MQNPIPLTARGRPLRPPVLASYFPRAFQNFRTEGGAIFFGIIAQIIIITLLISMPTLTLFPKKDKHFNQDGHNQHFLGKVIRLQLKEAIPQNRRGVILTVTRFCLSFLLLFQIASDI